MVVNFCTSGLQWENSHDIDSIYLSKVLDIIWCVVGLSNLYLWIEFNVMLLLVYAIYRPDILWRK
jgi:hypothetical protein